jgi:excisionase family DNA binding protein
VNDIQHFGGARRIRVNNVARRLGIPARTVRHLAATKRLPGYKIGDKIWFFNISDIEAYQGSPGLNRQQQVRP